MKKIFKYPLGIRGRYYIATHEGAEVIHAGAQNGVATIWAEVDDSRPLYKREFEVLFTGDTVKDNNLHYVGTAFIEGLVSHVYEVLT